MSNEDKREERGSGGSEDQRGPGDESGIIVFGGGGRGCAGRGCLFWIVVSIVLSVSLTILVNLIFSLFSGSAAGVGVSRTCHRFVARRPAVETEGELLTRFGALSARCPERASESADLLRR